MKLTQEIIDSLALDHFKGMDLSYANFEELWINSFDFSGCNLTGANLIGADLNNTNLNNANLWSANLTHVNLTGANLSGANLTGAYLEGINLKDTDLTNCIINKHISQISDELIKKFEIIVVE